MIDDDTATIVPQPDVVQPDVAPLPTEPAVAPTTTPAPPTNPYNPTHSPTCRCPSCCKKAKLARGEVIKIRSDKKPAAPKAAAPPPVVAPSKPKLDTTARATVAATARWLNEAATHYDWAGAPLEEANAQLSFLRKEIEIGGRALQQRYSTSLNPTVQCHVCHKDIENGKWSQARTVRNADTGLLEQLYLCGQLCIARYQQNPGNYPSALGPTGLPKPEPPEFTKVAVSRKGAN
jgi:hypothetical protein